MKALIMYFTGEKKQNNYHKLNLKNFDLVKNINAQHKILKTHNNGDINKNRNYFTEFLMSPLLWVFLRFYAGH